MILSNDLRARLEPTEEPLTNKLWPGSDKRDVVIYNSKRKQVRRYFWFEVDKPGLGESTITISGETFKLKWVEGK